jgi:hypothetical protein
MASNTKRRPGREPPLASGWHGYVCSGCDHYHIELLDKRDDCFAIMSIAPVDMLPLAQALLQIVDELQQGGSINSPTTH